MEKDEKEQTDEEIEDEEEEIDNEEPKKVKSSNGCTSVEVDF